MNLFKILPAFVFISLIISSCKKENNGNTETLNWTYSTAFGSGGTGNGQFQLLTGVGVDASGNVYTTDINLSRVQKFNSSGTFITEWGGTYDTLDGMFKWPRAVVTNTDGTVEVLDQDNCRIQKFTPGGSFLSKFGTCGNGDGQFGEFYDMERDANGILYVVDWENNRIQKFSAQRNFLLSWDFGFVYGNPTDIACSSTGEVYVSFDDSYSVPRKETIVHYSPTGTVSDSWEVAFADTVGGYIEAIDFDSEDNLHVGGSDALIRIYKKDGTFIKQWGTKGTGPGEILGLNALRFGPDDDLYIGGCAGNGNCRISKFTRSN
jgi:tripartite motif-containing protein 71